MTNVFITGGTGFLGKAIIAQLARKSEYGKIFLLVRPGQNKSAKERVDELVNLIFRPEEAEKYRSKIESVEGDLTKPHLGLSAQQHFRLKSLVHQILHVGASTDFGAPIKESREYNVEGTRRVLEYAELCRAAGTLERFDYVSTAFVAGTKSGEVSENDLDRKQNFANNYERTKWEAERLVHEYSYKFPVVVYRPSIVVGDSRHGYTPHFKVLYWPLKLLTKQVLPVVPLNPFSRLDVVPIDYVADSIVALMGFDGALGQTFHITAGKGNELRVGRLLRESQVHAGIKPVPIVPMWIFNLIRFTPLKYIMKKDYWEACELAAPYYFYLKGCDVVFNADRTHAVLAQFGISAPKWESYGKQILKFCQESRWGRRLRQPVYNYYLEEPIKNVAALDMPLQQG